MTKKISKSKTRRILDAVDCVSWFRNEYGFLPTVEEVGLEMGVAKSYAWLLLNMAVDLGLMTKNRRRYVPINPQDREEVLFVLYETGVLR